MTHQTIDFDSLDALVTAASAPSSWATRDSREGDFSFTGTRSFDQACEFARHGWQDGLSRMQCALDAVKASNTASGPAPGFLLDVAGAYPIAALAAAGDAFCMMAPTPISQRARPILRLATSTALPATYKPAEVFNYGSALVAVIDALEGAGFSVELASVRCNVSASQNDQRLTIRTTLKGAGDALDLERLAFCLGSASYNRRLHFGVVEARCPSGPWAGSYGSAVKPQHGLDVDHDVTILPGPTMFDQGSDTLASPEACFAAMLPAVTALLADRYASFPAMAWQAAA
jgi:hypothetical protein